MSNSIQLLDLKFEHVYNLKSVGDSVFQLVFSEFSKLTYSISMSVCVCKGPSAFLEKKKY